MKNFPIIDKLGGRTAVRDMLSDLTGAIIGKNTVNNWHDRNYIPRDKIILLMDCADARDIDYDRREDFGPPAPMPKYRGPKETAR